MMTKWQWVFGMVAAMVFAAALLLTGEPKPDPLAGLSDKEYIERALGCEVDVRNDMVEGPPAIAVVLRFPPSPPGFENVVMSRIRLRLQEHPNDSVTRWHR